MSFTGTGRMLERKGITGNPSQISHGTERFSFHLHCLLWQTEWLMYNTTFCWRLRAQTKPVLKCSQQKVMAVNVSEEEGKSYLLTRPQWPEFSWLVHDRHYRNRQACGWRNSCGLPWQPLHGPALPGVFGLAWPGLEDTHVRTQSSIYTQLLPCMGGGDLSLAAAKNSPSFCVH